MKKIIFLFSLILMMSSSCSEFMNCKNMNKQEVLFLFDISDAKLYTETCSDLKDNLIKFYENAPFRKLKECESLTFTIGNLSAKDELSTTSSSISIDQKGISGNEIKKRGNPRILLKALSDRTQQYKTLSENKEYNASTNICQTLLKSIVNLGDEGNNTILIFSDMVVNNKLERVSFYSKVPSDISGTIEKLVDPLLISSVKERLDSGLDLRIIVVLKNEPQGKVKKKEIKAFWKNAFDNLGLKDVQFIDNLSNKIQWD